MYYYQIQDVNGQIVDDSSVAYDTGDDAANAARDQLASMYPPNYPVEIRISDKPFFESPRYFSSTYYMSAEDVRQHALSRIEKANAAVLQYEIKIAVEEFNAHKEQYDRGLITPLEFAQTIEGDWIRARVNIELLMHK